MNSPVYLLDIIMEFTSGHHILSSFVYDMDFPSMKSIVSFRFIGESLDIVLLLLYVYFKSNCY